MATTPMVSINMISHHPAIRLPSDCHQTASIHPSLLRTRSDRRDFSLEEPGWRAWPLIDRLHAARFTLSPEEQLLPHLETGLVCGDGDWWCGTCRNAAKPIESRLITILRCWARGVWETGTDSQSRSLGGGSLAIGMGRK
ncbi:hypothetical protein MMC07_009324, partial [Pseudocyphellaria aurata]|nr:hypothetical protein [Pseudocyphellaria aurata]